MITSFVFIFILRSTNFSFIDNKRLLHSSGHHSSSSHHSSSGHHSSSSHHSSDGHYSSDQSISKSENHNQENNKLDTIKWDKPIYKKGSIIAINYYIILYGINYQYQQNNEIKYLNIHNETHWCKVELKECLIIPF